MDILYDASTQEGQELERGTIAYGIERLSKEIKYTFSVLAQTIEDCSSSPKFLRTTVRPGSNGQYPIKAPFYAVFMAFHDLIVKEKKGPADSERIMNALKGLSSKVKAGAHYETTDNRRSNIALTKGLIQDYFASHVPPAFGHGASLLLDFENAIRRSKIESPRYEFKQGVLQLNNQRTPDPNILSELVRTSAAIANIGPESDGNIFIGVTDKTSDAERVKQLDLELV